MIIHKLRAKSLMLCCKLCFLSLCVFCLLFTTPTSAQFCDVVVPGEVFCDDFTNPSPTAPGREPVQWRNDVTDAGNLSIVDDSLQIDGTGTLSRTGPASVVLGDVSVRTQVTSSPLAAPLIQVRFNRSLYPGDTGYFATSLPDGEFGIGISGGNARIIASSMTDLDPTQEDVLWQLDVFGSELGLYAWRPNEGFPSEPLVSVTDDTVTHAGELRLGVGRETAGAHSSLFRFVQVAAQPIPEPSTSALLAIAGVMLALLRRTT